MRIDFDDGLFDPTKGPLDVLGLLGLCVRMGHVVGSRESVVARWASELSPAVGVAAEDLFAKHRELLGTVDNKHAIMVGAGQSDWSNKTLGLEDAWRFVRTPLEVLLENERGDWLFLRRIATPAQRQILDDAIGRGALAIRQGGGIGELKKSVDALHDGPEELGTRVRRLRTWVMFDRDADPNDNRNPDAVAVQTAAACSKRVATDPWHLGFHRLKRRHIESYIPDRLLRKWTSRKGHYLQAAAQGLKDLRSTNADAADSLHMKGGLRMAFDKAIRDGLTHASSPNRERRRGDEATLVDWPEPWPSVLSDVRADLLAGFGGDVASLYRTAPPGYDQEFRAEFGLREGTSANMFVNSLLERI